jgi:hypothetical protein
MDLVVQVENFPLDLLSVLCDLFGIHKHYTNKPPLFHKANGKDNFTRPKWTNYMAS